MVTHMTKPLRRPAILRACSTLATAAALALTAAPAQAATPPIAVGVNIENAPGQMAPLQAYVSLTHHAPVIVMWYQEWSEPLYWSRQMTNVTAVGAIPMITWDPSRNGAGIPLSEIAGGRYDAYIRASAISAAAFRQPVYIRLAHEMNLGDSPFGPGRQGNTAALFVAAWRHVVSIFSAEHATNVEWVWSPNIDCSGRCPFSALYPGDAWVDWVGLDGYNYSTINHAPWLSLDQIFQRSYGEVTALTAKPVMIAETASTEVGGSKALWITQSFANLATRYPHLHAVVWFDRNKETDWRVNSSATSLAAWDSVLASPANQGTAATLLSEAPVSADVTGARRPLGASPRAPAPFAVSIRTQRRSAHRVPHG
jgi:hypothetical protein